MYLSAIQIAIIVHKYKPFVCYGKKDGKGKCKNVFALKNPSSKQAGISYQFWAKAQFSSDQVLPDNKAGIVEAWRR